jgi:hypothetical protein
MPKAATRAVLQKNSTAEMMAASDFSFGTWNFQQPSKFGHILNNRNRGRSGRGLWCHVTSWMPKVATRADLQKNSTAEKRVASDFSFSIYNIQQPSKFRRAISSWKKKIKKKG